MELEQKTVQAMEDLEEAVLTECVDELIAQGTDYRRIEQLLQEGMKGVGRRFETGEYFLADLIMSGELFKDIMAKIRLGREKEAAEDSLGVILMGVMEGDIHDIGKDIVCQTLCAEGFQVIDLGVDVEPERFVEAALACKPDIIAMSGVMGFCVEKMQRIIELLKEKGIRDRVKVVVGGSCMNSAVCQALGADGYTADPIENAALCKKWMEMNDGEE